MRLGEKNADVFVAISSLEEKRAKFFEKRHFDNYEVIFLWKEKIEK